MDQFSLFVTLVTNSGLKLEIIQKVEDIDVNKDRVVKDTEILHLENLEDKERYEKAPLWKKILIICFD